MQTDIDNTPRGDELHLAAVSGDLALVRELVRQGSDVNVFDEFGMTPLHYAVSEGYFEVATLLVRSGADVNARSEVMIGDTPLGQVAGECSPEIARLLIDAGADPRIRGWMQSTRSIALATGLTRMGQRCTRCYRITVGTLPLMPNEELKPMAAGVAAGLTPAR